MANEFLKALHKKKAPGLDENDDDNRVTYVTILEALFPVVEERFIDNAVRTVTTHIMDVPLRGHIARVEIDIPPKFVFSSERILCDFRLEELLKIRDDLEGERKGVSEKVEELEKLWTALRGEPSCSKQLKNGTIPSTETRVEEKSSYSEIE